MQIGLVYNEIHDLKSEFDFCRDQSFNYITIPLFYSKIAEHENYTNLPSAISWNGVDLLLKSNEWANSVNLKLSSWFFEKNLDCVDLTNKMEVMRKEIEYACHLGVSIMTIDINEYTNCSCVSQIICEYLQKGKIKSQIIINAIEDSKNLDSESYSEYLGSMISKFEKICLQCDNPINLTFSFDMSVYELSNNILRRIDGIKWLSVFLDQKRFHQNRKGFPILSKYTRYILFKILKYKAVKIFLKLNQKEKIFNYLNYLKHIYIKYSQSNMEPSHFENYEDVPQIPLQPLSRNLESYVYEIFEDDPYKYLEYENAIVSYFNDSLKQEISDHNILLVGAGRGPIVTCIIRASDICKVNVEIIALEKNENAIPTLIEKFKSYENVKIVHSDIRDWNNSDWKADVVVSELLGSFGDNELSPECLEAAKRYTHEKTVFIPSSYTSYICPVSAPELYSEIAYVKSISHPEPYETPYVSHLYTSSLLSSIKICFQFDHSLIDKSYKETGNRYQNLKFKIDTSGIIHGFAGYFSCVLYKDIMLSINPLYSTPGIFSWLPFFFPIKNALYIETGTFVEISIWRRSCSSYIWYEWSLDHPYVSKIHNSRGKYYKIHLQ